MGPARRWTHASMMPHSGSFLKQMRAAAGPDSTARRSRRVESSVSSTETPRSAAAASCVSARQSRRRRAAIRDGNARESRHAPQLLCWYRYSYRRSGLCRSGTVDRTPRHRCGGTARTAPGATERTAWTTGAFRNGVSRPRFETARSDSLREVVPRFRLKPQSRAGCVLRIPHARRPGQQPSHLDTLCLATAVTALEPLRCG